jgi:hypothetical protein
MGEMADHDAEVYGFVSNYFRVRVPGVRPPAAPTASVLRSQMAALAAEVVRIEALPKEPDAKVIRFRKCYRNTGANGNNWYSYAALKVGDAWFVTGQVTASYTWDQLLVFIGDEYLHTIRVAAGWQKLGA